VPTSGLFGWRLHVPALERPIGAADRIDSIACEGYCGDGNIIVADEARRGTAAGGDGALTRARRPTSSPALLPALRAFSSSSRRRLRSSRARSAAGNARHFIAERRHCERQRRTALDKTGVKVSQEAGASRSLPPHETRPQAVFLPLACGATPGMAHFPSPNTTVAMSCISFPTASVTVLRVTFSCGVPKPWWIVA
jgi:hypothetical protein